MDIEGTEVDVHDDERAQRQEGFDSVEQGRVGVVHDFVRFEPVYGDPRDAPGELFEGWELTGDELAQRLPLFEREHRAIFEIVAHLERQEGRRGASLENSSLQAGLFGMRDVDAV